MPNWTGQRYDREPRYLKYEDVKNPDRDWDRDKWEFSCAMCSYMPDLFSDCDGNHEVESVLREAKVIKKNNQTDTEDCQFHIAFSSRAAANSFVDRFNKWAKRVRENKKNKSHFYK